MSRKPYKTLRRMVKARMEQKLNELKLKEKLATAKEKRATKKKKVEKGKIDGKVMLERTLTVAGSIPDTFNAIEFELNLKAKKDREWIANYGMTEEQMLKQRRMWGQKG